MVVEDHGGLPDAAVGAEHRLHLPRLDAVAPELDLVVEAAEELELAVGAEPRPVPGAVEPAEDRVLDEALRREVGASAVAPGQAGTPR